MAISDIPDVVLPTLSLLHATSLTPETELDAHKIASDWLSTFSTAIEEKDVPQVTSLMLPDATGPTPGSIVQCFWRDMLALTWDFRTFRGKDVITQFLIDRLPLVHMHSLTLDEKTLPPTLQWPYPDLVWINFFIKFETDIGLGSGIIRLVPTASSSANQIEWKAHVLFTNLEDLKGFPENIGPLRNQLPNHGKWEQEREKEKQFEGKDPTVLIIGAGHSGLDLGARLKSLGISSLLVERNERVGDNWRNRYEALCLHDPVWYDHFPYMSFPPNWPTYSPAAKLASWLEYYADAMELNVWTSTTVTHATQDSNNKWHVRVRHSDGKERTFIVKHLVFATGIGGGTPAKFDYPGIENFKGKCMHSSEHRFASDFVGKKVVVVGSCTSAHDIAEDFYNHGIDVTIIQRGPTYIMTTKNGWDVLFRGLYTEDGPPTDVADRINASFPHWMAIGLNQRLTTEIAELDKELLDGLQRVGFKLGYGIKGTGFPLLAWNKAGGYYLDTGASKLVAEGKIKLKNDSTIKRINDHGIEFEDGSVLPADAIVFATGYGDAVDKIKTVCGEEVTNRVKKIWGLNKEGEINGVWRDLGLPNMWYMIGNLALGRFHSKHVALQIKAIEEGIFGPRYGLQE